jgi:hypothetical protein
MIFFWCEISTEVFLSNCSFLVHIFYRKVFPKVLLWNFVPEISVLDFFVNFCSKIFDKISFLTFFPKNFLPKFLFECF